MENKIIYQDVSPGAREESNFIATGEQAFSDVRDLKTELSPPKTHSLETNRWKLDGSFNTMPPAFSSEGWGYWSEQMCNDSGLFSTPPSITVSFDTNHTSVGLTLLFDESTGDYCSACEIKWYRGTVLLAQQSYAPTAARYECIREVEFYNKIVITFSEMCLPHRFLRVCGIIFGVERVFTGADIDDESLTIVEEISPIGAEISINTINFGLRSESSIPFLFQKKQPLVVYHGKQQMGTFYIDTAKRKSEYQYEIGAFDAVGVLDESEYLGGIFTGETVATVAQDIIGNAFTCSIAPELARIKVYGYLPISTRREALGQLGFAIGAMVDTQRTDKICIFKSGETVTQFDNARVYEGLEVETDSLVTGVQVTAHKYEVTTAEQVENIFEGTLFGETTLKFSEPMHSLAITGGAVTKSGANFAVISGSGMVMLTGKKYHHTTQVIEISNMQLTAMDKANVKKVDKATLVTLENADAVAQRVYHYYSKRDTIRATVSLDCEDVGSKAEIKTLYAGTRVGVVSQMEIDIGNALIAKVVLR